jgi:AAA15 family ATPase/GTPase
MKIRSLTLENFKSFKRLELKEFLDVNMIYGYNNSGKSNLLKFLELVFATQETSRNMSVTVGTQITSEKVTETENFWSKLIPNVPFIFRRENRKRFDVSFSIGIEVTKDELKKALGNGGYESLEKEYITTTDSSVTIAFDGKIVALGDYNAQQSLSKVVFDGKEIYTLDKDNNAKTFEGSKTLTFGHFQNLLIPFNDCILLLDNDRYFINEREEHDGKKLHSKNFKSTLFNDFLTHSKEEDLEELMKFIRKFKLNPGDGVFKNNELSSPFNDFKFEFVRLNGDIEIMLRNQFGRFPLSSFGTGIQQVIYVLSRIYLANRRIVLIEEIELNLSPKYQTELIDFMYSKLIQGDKTIDQLFYSTHSPLMCYRTEFRSMQARIDADGVSSVEKLAPKPEDIKKFKEAHDLLEQYHPAVAKQEVTNGKGG